MVSGLGSGFNIKGNGLEIYGLWIIISIGPGLYYGFRVENNKDFLCNF